MDGTGELFKGFVEALPVGVEAEIIRYPRDLQLSNAELDTFIEAAIPVKEPFVLLAESFSTPLAVRCAARNQPNLKGLILCAGFATSPINGWRVPAGSLLAPILFRLPLPSFVARYFLVGRNAPQSLAAAVQAAVSSIKPGVLTARLRAIFACDVRAELSRVTTPVLLIQAKNDRLVSERSLAEIRRIQPQAEVAALPGPHLVLQREPGCCAEVVAEFIGQLRSS
jgi:pimeloyl-ACP methyl ester carboxylesterase